MHTMPIFTRLKNQKSVFPISKSIILFGKMKNFFCIYSHHTQHYSYLTQNITYYKTNHYFCNVNIIAGIIG